MKEFIDNIKSLLRCGNPNALSKSVMAVFAILFSAMLIGCSNSDDPKADDEIIVPEGMELLTLMLPDYGDGAAQFGSRAFNTEEEGFMSNLYVIAIKYYEADETDLTKEPQKKVYTYSLNPVGRKFEVGEEKYHVFNLTLFPGKYKFALVANVDLYLKRQSQISGFTTEEDLQKIVLNYSEDTPLAPTHLPMVCLPDEIRFKEKTTETVTENDPVKGQVVKTITSYSDEMNGEGEHNLITIGDKSKDTNNKSITNVVCAKMKFLCSKVRYTILFNKEPGQISEAFGSSWIRFNVDDQLKPTAHNIRKQTKLELKSTSDDADFDEVNHFIMHDENTLAVWNVNIDRFYWPEDQGADYPRSPSATLTQWDKTTDDWIPMTKKAWQGVIYLPENDLPDMIDKTYLEFPYHLRANSLDETPEKEASAPKRIYLFGNPGESQFQGTDKSSGEYSPSSGRFNGLERNYMYDVVALVRNPEDVPNMDIRVFVSILPWHETDQGLNEDDLYNEPSK